MNKKPIYKALKIFLNPKMKIFICIFFFFWLTSIIVKCKMLVKRQDNGTKTGDLNSTMGLIFIVKNSTEPIILAEPNTLPSLKETSIVVESSILPFHDIHFIWALHPADNQLFQETEGLALIRKNTTSVRIAIRTKNTNTPSLNQVVYKFYLNKIIEANTTQETKNQSFFINSLASSVLIRILPSNYPFGYFEYSNEIPSNLTLSK